MLEGCIILVFASLGAPNCTSNGHRELNPIALCPPVTGKGHFCHIIYIAPVPLTNGVHKHSFMKNINFILVLMTTISKYEKHPSIFSMSVGLTNHHNLSKSL